MALGAVQIKIPSTAGVEIPLRHDVYYMNVFAKLIDKSKHTFAIIYLQVYIEYTYIYVSVCFVKIAANETVWSL